ncbi:hypothetical protein [Winogradskyella schleiferi]|uniref:hypothetical protein n=1 Tax=Winogradskyella schleiferi TaxID=2686078 RepID=UPI001E29ED8B|nr:hypothetical protein [Winogradskyella schleiferi]
MSFQSQSQLAVYKIKTAKQFLLCSIMITLFSSCSQYEGKFTVSNQSDFDIDSLTILPDTKQQSIRLEKGEKINYYSSMGEKIPEGSYSISFRNSKNKEMSSKKFGYYSSGMQLEDKINIIILNDDIEIEYVFDKYDNK